MSFVNGEMIYEGRGAYALASDKERIARAEQYVKERDAFNQKVSDFVKNLDKRK